MKRLIFICGIVAGLISTSFFIGLMIIGKAPDENFKYGMIIGYTLMILGFSMIFVATRITRDKYDGGVISFGKAFRIGLYITLIATAVYVIVWMIDLNLFIPDFAEKYAASSLEHLKASGASEAEIAKKNLENANLIQMYKNPLFVVLLTAVEILPVGLLVSLISAFVLKRKRKASIG